jgi:hypothetical protein
MTMRMRLPSAVRPLLAALVFLTLLAVPASAAAPAATGLPVVSGTARAGQVLTSTTGIFSGTAPLTYGRTWQRCDTTGAACTPIVGASAATYTLAAADVGTTIRVTVMATNVEGSASSTSAPTPIVAPLAPPVNDSSALPAVSGTARDGQLLSATDGTWSGTAPITFTRLWQRCDAAGAACTGVSSTPTRTLTSADVGATIRVEITAKNADGQSIATSAQTAVVDAAAPVNSALPAISGATRSGQTLTSSSPGTWTGTTPMTYARQWTRCDAAGGACVPIAGEVGTTYVLADGDIGATIRVAVTATNVKTSATASSAASAVVGARVPPQKSADPAITGSPVDGQVLTAADGSWTGTPAITTARRWQRCQPLGLNCVELAASGTTLTLASADVGFTFRTRATATNPDGTTEALSALTPTIGPALPSATVAPAVTGTAKEGQLLSASQGTWKGTPSIAYDYAWQRCSAGVCSAISGESATTYRLAPADVGKTVRVVVTATNAAGATPAPSAQTAAVAGGVPVNLVAPDISGPLPRDGELYSSTLGSWAGTAPLVQASQWLRCNATGAACAPLSGEVASGYRLASADVGKTLRVEVTTTNALGATKAQSAPSPVILAAPPTADAAPAISGVLRDGQTITATGSWSGTPPITLSYQWQRCDALVPTCVDIAGATAASYRLTSPEVGARMRVRVGALNAGGGGVALSDLAVAGDPAGVVAPDAPTATGAPLLTGTAVEGSTLTSGDGTFTGTLPLTRAIRWQRCAADGSGCVDIAAATGADRTLTAADRGATLRSVVTATNGSGSDSIASAPSAVVALAPPRNLVAPSVAPDTGLRDGATLTSTDGGWAGSAPLSLSYRWQRCKTPTTTCTDVPGAAGPSYMLTTADAGFYMRLVVTASNGAGSTSQASATTGIVGTNPPQSVAPPTISGTARDGSVLTAVDGLWTGPVSYQTSYEWWRCDTAGANCSVVPGATAASLVLGPADIGVTMRARVTRTSAGGATAVFSAPTAPVLAAPPENVTPPIISGGAALAKPLTAAPGSWTGTAPVDYVYQWRRCAADGSGCADIDGATAATYTAMADDGGARLRVVVSANNAVGGAVATSAATLVVQTAPPSMLTPPSIVAPAGPVAAGVTLTAQPGTWDGAIPIAFTYRWSRCDAALVSCSTIAAATASSYALVTADVGKRIVASVTATNVVDAATADADASSTVLPEPPSRVTPPAVTAAAGLRTGAKLVATTGTWSGATPIIYAVTWLRCDTDGTGCGVVAGAAGTSYTLTADDVGHRMRARVAATNATAEATADSSATVAVAAAPVSPPPPPPAPPAVTPAKPPTTTPATTPATTTTKPATGTTQNSTTKDSSTTKKKTSTSTSTSTTKKTGTTTSKSTTAKAKTKTKRSTTPPIADVQRLRITPGGVVILTVRCPRYRTRSCGASGTILAGTALGEVIPDTPLSFKIRAVSVPKGKTRTRLFKLTTAQREALKTLSTVNFRVRIAAPSKPKRVNEVFVHASVPAPLRAG